MSILRLSLAELNQWISRGLHKGRYDLENAVEKGNQREMRKTVKTAPDDETSMHANGDCRAWEERRHKVDSTHNVQRTINSGNLAATEFQKQSHDVGPKNWRQTKRTEMSLSRTQLCSLTNVAATTFSKKHMCIE